MSMTRCPHCTNEHVCHAGRKQAHPEMRSEIQRLLHGAESHVDLEATGPAQTAAEGIWLGRMDAYIQALRVMGSSE